MNLCSHPECLEEGDFPAPTDPKDLSLRQYFCEQHIKEFNKKWNGLDGMTENDVFAMQTDTWDRPTWRLGISGKEKSQIDLEFSKAEDLFAFFKARSFEDKLSDEINRERGIPVDVEESCSILGVTLPTDQVSLKKTYIKLMKKHHPDKNKGDENAQDFAKKLNVAYKILEEWVI